MNHESPLQTISLLMLFSYGLEISTLIWILLSIFIHREITGNENENPINVSGNYYERDTRRHVTREIRLQIISHPMSWLAVTFTTQEINSLRQPAINSLFLLGLSLYFLSFSYLYSKERDQRLEPRSQILSLHIQNIFSLTSLFFKL